MRTIRARRCGRALRALVGLFGGVGLAFYFLFLGGFWGLLDAYVESTFGEEE